MKPATTIFSLILVLILVFCLFFYSGGTLVPQASSLNADAAEYPDAFESIRSILSTGTAPQTFSGDTLDDASNFRLVDVNISLTNRGIFDAEWLNIQLNPAVGDVAVYSISGNGTDVAARSTGQINLKLITRAPADSRRSVSIQYYVYGISRTIEVEI